MHAHERLSPATKWMPEKDITAAAHSTRLAASAASKAILVATGLRQEAQTRLLQALERNPHLQGADRGDQLQQWALACEGTCLDKSQGNR